MPTPLISRKPPSYNAARHISYLDGLLDETLPMAIRKNDDIYSDLDGLSWAQELSDVVTYKKYNKWIAALTTYKEDPMKLAIVLYVLVKLMDEDKENGNKLNKLLKNTPAVQSQLLYQLSNTEGDQKERLFFNGIYLLATLLQDDIYKCDSAPVIISYMLNIIKKYNNIDGAEAAEGIVYYALVVIDSLKDCTNTYLAEGSVLRLQLSEGSILRSIDREQLENVALANDIIKHVTKMTTINYDGGRRRTHKKRRAVKKTRRSRK